MTDLEAVLDGVAERRPSLIDLGLERMKTALKALGDPHEKLPPVIHVAGTNGKGSTIAYMKAILETAGGRVHVFTSPHLVRYNERVVLAGDEISDAAFADVLQRCDEAVADDALTFFETITCAALLAFAEAPADYLLLEVGLGGRLDATNVLEKPLATVITPIALDHQYFLGDDLATIAKEKAGIFRKNVPAVIGPQTPEAMAALEQCADEAGADMFSFGTAWNAFMEQGRLVYQDTDGLSDLAPPRLLGAHQVMNAGLAVAALRAAGVIVNDQIISQGLQKAQWRGRLQRLIKGPLVDLLAKKAPAGSEIWLDGGHNPHAARAIAAAFSDLEERASARLIIIAGMQANKDLQGYFAAFEGLARLVLTVTSGHKAAASPEEVAVAAHKAGIAAVPCSSLEEALLLAINEKEADEDALGEEGTEPLRVLIGGSLYLAGDVLAGHG